MNQTIQFSEISILHAPTMAPIPYIIIYVKSLCTAISQVCHTFLAVPSGGGNEPAIAISAAVVVSLILLLVVTVVVAAIYIRRCLKNIPPDQEG